MPPFLCRVEQRAHTVIECFFIERAQIRLIQFPDEETYHIRGMLRKQARKIIFGFGVVKELCDAEALPQCIQIKDRIRIPEPP